MFGFMFLFLCKILGILFLVWRIFNIILEDLGILVLVLKFICYYIKFDNCEVVVVLEGLGIKCLDLNDYVWCLWDFWECNLDLELFID